MFQPTLMHPRVVFLAAEAASSTLDRFVARRADLGWPVDALCVLPIPLDLKDSRNPTARCPHQTRTAQRVLHRMANASGAGAEDNQDMPKYAQAISKMVLQTGAAGMITHESA